MEPYYADDLVKLFLGDAREVPGWKDADFLLCDPPYGRNWRQGTLRNAKERKFRKSNSRDGIEGDASTHLRDWMLDTWGDKIAAVFGDLMLAPPAGTKQVLAYQKPPDAGRRGATGGFRRDIEAVYLLGKWPSGIGNSRGDGHSSVLRTWHTMVSGANGMAAQAGHPLAKPVDVLERLIMAAGFPQLIADPFCGSGSTLVAAKQLSLRAVGVEIDERYAERAAHRLSNELLLL